MGRRDIKIERMELEEKGGKGVWRRERRGMISVSEDPLLSSQIQPQRTHGVPWPGGPGDL